MAQCTVTLNIGDGPDLRSARGVYIERLVEGFNGQLQVLAKAATPTPLRTDGAFSAVFLERGEIYRFRVPGVGEWIKLVPSAATSTFSALVDVEPAPTPPIPSGAQFAQDFADEFSGGFMPLDGEVAPTGTAIRVGTYNLRKTSLDVGVSGRQWSDRRAQAATDVLTSLAKVIALQEVENADNPTTSQAVDLVGQINAQLGQPGRWTAQVRNSYPAIWDTQVVSEPDAGARNYVALNPTLGYRGAATSVLEVGATPFTFVATHYHHQADIVPPTTGVRWSLGRLHAEANALLAAWYASTTGPVIIGGDFNSHLTPLALQANGLATVRGAAPVVTNGSFVSANAFATSPARLGRWFDHILCGRDVTPLAAGMVMTFASGNDYPLKTPMGSDHHVMWADVLIREAA